MRIVSRNSIQIAIPTKKVVVFFLSPRGSQGQAHHYNRAHKITPPLYNQAHVIHAHLMIGLPKVPITLCLNELTRMPIYLIIRLTKICSKFVIRLTNIPALFIIGLAKVPAHFIIGDGSQRYLLAHFIYSWGHTDTNKRNVWFAWFPAHRYVVQDYRL